MAFVILLLIGCGNEKRSIFALKWNDMLLADISENIEEARQSIDRRMERVGNTIRYSKNTLEDVECATVSDGTYSITLGMHLKDLIYDEEELPWDGVTVDNRATTLVVEGDAHDIIFHPYNDFTLYTSNYNHLNGDFFGYYNYIHEIKLKTARFQTSDGFRIGMSEKELKDFYGNKLNEEGKWGDDGYFYQIDMTDHVFAVFVINTEGMIKEISIRTDYLKYY